MLLGVMGMFVNKECRMLWACYVVIFCIVMNHICVWSIEMGDVCL